MTTWDSRSIRKGMLVRSTEGERIGKVIRCDDTTFVVEKGAVLPKDYELRYDHITALSGDTIVYSLSEFLDRERARGKARSEAVAGGTAAAAAGGGAAMAAAAAARKAAEPAAPELPAAEERAPAGERLASNGHELRIPLMAEEIGVEKVSRETGHVRIHKAVKSEERHFTVPVMREEVVIEHVAAASASAAPREPAFEEETFDVALHEQELRVTKRPRLREEVVVRTVSEVVEREASATLRHEEAEIDDSRRTSASFGAGDDPRSRLRA